ncbi:DNA adenine methylase [Erythrobacter aureus]|uniref:DNA adenine methylase n=1 Tax=Erythrobacter aureus TaxID=2182384 RepID=A0A345YIG9_9SPHN|nr:DNA adenine methylase [Erythrobacter aureus]AXK43721.1 DNA adenine methylase [Erythrobacter aureus]
MSAAIRLATNEPAHNDNPRAPGMSAVRRPALRYHGGKFMLASWIISNMPTHRTYVEPFAGACSVLLRKTRTYAEVANDLNLKIYDYFKVLRDPSSYAHLKRALQFTPFHEREFRLSLEDCDDPIEQARRLCVRSFLSHGSDGVTSSTVPGFRSSISRAGSTPATDWSNLPGHMDAIHERLQRVTWLTMDAMEVIEKYRTSDTLLYVDPPYHPSTRHDKISVGDTYRAYGHELDADGHEKLLVALRETPAMVMLSGYRCEIYDDMLSDWVRLDTRAQSDGNAKKTESLWLNPAAADNRPSPSLFGA